MRKARKAFALCAWMVLSFVQNSAASFVAPTENRTLFQYAETSWGVGTIRLGKPLQFRDGKVLVFPSQISDLVWAPNGTKPRNLMLVYEVPADDSKDKPFFSYNDEFLAPIRVLPEHSYWRDNLPNTPRHEVYGGRRYVFRGDEIPEVKQILAEYLAAHELKTMDRWTGQGAVVAGALGSKIRVVREDAASYLTNDPNLARDFSDKAVAPVAAYLAGDAPAEEKSGLIQALAAAKIVAVKPALQDLAKRDDATGAAALQGLDSLGDSPATERLVTMSHSKSDEMRAYAAGALGRRGATDAAALARSKQLLDDDLEKPVVTAAAAAGLASAGGDQAVAVLAEVLGRGQSSSGAAAEALARIGGPAASGVLVKTLKEKQGQAALAAASGLGAIESCVECGEVLRQQYKAHPDPAVRKMIGVILEVPAEHKH